MIVQQRATLRQSKGTCTSSRCDIWLRQSCAATVGKLCRWAFVTKQYM